MSVIIREALGNPKPPSIRRTGEIPWSKFDWTQSFHIPYVEEFMRDRIKRVAVNAGLTQRARLDNLCGCQMLHAIAGVIVGGEVEQKSIGVELRRPPHRGFRSHNFFNITDEGRALAAFVAKR